MWTHEHVGETTVAPHQVWRVLTDLDRWADWDTSMEWVRLDGEFATGSAVTMKPIGQDPIVSTIIEIDHDHRYADRTEFGGVILDFSHTLEPADAGGTRVIHRLEISGDRSEEIGPELGPAITEDFPDAMAALLAQAERRAGEAPAT